MKRFLCIIATVFFLTCSVYTSQFPGTIDKKLHVYNNDSLQISLAPPKDWQLFDKSSSDRAPSVLSNFDLLSKIVFSMTNTKRRAFGRLLVCEKDYTFHEFLKIHANHLTSDSSAIITNSSWVRFGSDSAAIIEYISNPKKELNNRFFEMVFEQSGHVLQFQFWTLSALFEDYEGTRLSIINQLLSRNHQQKSDALRLTSEAIKNGRSIDFIPVRHRIFSNFKYGNPCVDSTKSFCWKIHSKTNTIYILGSIHLAKPELYPLKPVIEEAFNKSKVLVVEVNIESDKVKAEMKKYVADSRYAFGQSIEDHISKGVYTNLKKVMQDLGMPIYSFRIFQPWILATVITQMKLQKLGILPEYGLDNYFLKKANEKPNPKEIVELETATDQLNLLINFCNNELFLAYTLFGVDQMESQIVPLLAGWKCGNTDLIEKLSLQDDIELHPEFSQFIEKLVFSRNERIADKIADYLKDDRDYFIIFGSAHIVGKRGVIKLLENKGFVAEQM